MPEVTLTETYVCRGKILLPGTHQITEAQEKSLREIGVIGKDAGRPASEGETVYLASGAIVNPTPAGVTPGDPVQRASAVVNPVAPSAVDRQTADPSTDLPPPVVHTTEGQAVEPDPDAGDDGDDQSASPATTARPSRVTARPRGAPAATTE